MTELFDLAQKLGGVGLPTLLVCILYGSYKGIWVWGAQLRKAEADGDVWKTMALQAAGLLETTVSMAAKTRVS